MLNISEALTDLRARTFDLQKQILTITVLR